MRNAIVATLLVGALQCDEPSKVVCNQKIYRCFNECAKICNNTIKKKYQFGACFSKCTEPCRKEYCPEARMVKQVNTEDLKSFAAPGLGVQVPLRAICYEDK